LVTGQSGPRQRAYHPLYGRSGALWSTMEPSIPTPAMPKAMPLEPPRWRSRLIYRDVRRSLGKCGWWRVSCFALPPHK